MHLVSINIGVPQILLRGGRHYSTAFNKRPVATPIQLTPAGLEGDRVSDQKVHGGPDKAVCCYPHEHYAYWSGRLFKEREAAGDGLGAGAESANHRPTGLSIPAFGENFTTAGLLEEQVCIGDTFRIGSATVQITQPRQPCWKLANKHEQPQLIAWVNQTAFSGFYLRVLTVGTVSPNDSIELTNRPHPDLTVAFMTRFRLSPDPDPSILRRLADLPELSASWRQHMARSLTGSDEQAE